MLSLNASVTVIRYKGLEERLNGAAHRVQQSQLRKQAGQLINLVLRHTLLLQTL